MAVVESRDLCGSRKVTTDVLEGLEGKPLGLESGKIPNKRITCSSYARKTPASCARLDYPGCWCAGKLDCWLQVDLDEPHFVTAVSTQGNPFGNSDYTKKYKLQYSQDGVGWTTHVENVKKIFDANVDNTTVKTNDLQKVIVARYIRICPVEWYCWPCLRTEVYGVPLKEVEKRKQERHLQEENKRLLDEKKRNDEEEKERKKREEEERLRKEEERKKREEEERLRKEEEERKKREERLRKQEEERKKREERLRKQEEERKKREEEERLRKEEASWHAPVTTMETDEKTEEEEEDGKKEKDITKVEQPTVVSESEKKEKKNDKHKTTDELKEKLEKKDGEKEEEILPLVATIQTMRDEAGKGKQETNESHKEEAEEDGKKKHRKDPAEVEEPTEVGEGEKKGKQETNESHKDGKKNKDTAEVEEPTEVDDKEKKGKQEANESHKDGKKNKDTTEVEEPTEVDDKEKKGKQETNESHKEKAEEDGKKNKDTAEVEEPTEVDDKEKKGKQDERKKKHSKKKPTSCYQRRKRVKSKAETSQEDKKTAIQLYSPITAVRDQDIDLLIELEKEGAQGWKKDKTSRDFQIWKRKAQEGFPPVTKAILTLSDIPYEDAVDIIRDWDTRQEWDKTFDKVTILETIDTSRLVYCPVKKRELFLAVQERQHNEEEHYYASAWKNTAHPKIDDNNNKELKLEYLVSGLVIRPISSGGSQVTLLSQVKGSVPSQVKSTFLAANPTKWIEALKKYHASKTNENAVKEE